MLRGTQNEKGGRKIRSAANRDVTPQNYTYGVRPVANNDTFWAKKRKEVGTNKKSVMVLLCVAKDVQAVFMEMKDTTVYLEVYLLAVHLNSTCSGRIW
jgi:hypothetical protein